MSNEAKGQSGNPVKKKKAAAKLPALSHSERKAQLATDNTLVTRPIPRLDEGIVRDTKKSTTGRKKKYTPTKIKNKINDYFAYCEKEDDLPSIKGLMIHLNMYKDQFYQYLKYPEFTDIMEHARLIIGNWVETDIYNTKGMAAGKIAYAKNLLDWSDKLETNNHTTQQVITVDQARAKIESLAPKLLEVLKSNTTLLQLAHRDDKVTKKIDEPVIEAEIVNPKGRRI